MIEAGESEMTFMGLWARHKRDCRPISAIVSDARAGNLPGVEILESGFGHRVVNQQAALAAMQRSA